MKIKFQTTYFQFALSLSLSLREICFRLQTTVKKTVKENILIMDPHLQGSYR